MLRSLLLHALGTLSVFFIAGCSNTKYLPEGSYLYTGAAVKVEVDGEMPNRSKVLEGLNSVITPQPNASFLGMRPSLWFYHKAGEPEKDKGIRYWVRNKLGEPPVLLENVAPARVKNLMENRLNNSGYFHGTVEHRVDSADKKATITYIAKVNKPFTIASVNYPAEKNRLTRAIATLKDETLLVEGQPYDLDVLKEERARIDYALKNKGYYNFNQDFLLFRIDSAKGNHTLDVNMYIKEEVPAEGRRTYKLRNVYLNADDRTFNDNFEPDTVKYGPFYYFPNPEQEFRPRALMYNNFLVPDSLYRRFNHERTINRLMGMGAFRFVNITYRDAGSSDGSGLLDAYINMNTAPKKSLRLEVQGVSKSNNFVGPGLQASFTNRNAFGGGERLTVNVTGNYEVQVLGGGQTGLTSYEIGAETQLQVFRIISPFPFNNESSRFVPSTRFKIGYNLLNRVQLFQMQSFNFLYGYQWQTSARVQHELNPVNLNYVMLSRISPEFEEILQRDAFLRRSFEEQFILGSGYSYTYNTQLDVNRTRRDNFYFKGSVDVSGNVMQAIQNTINEEEATPDNPNQIFSLPYSQFSRFDVDFRYFYKVGSGGSKIASRLRVGVGLPYGNSLTMPYVKQFFIGGPNSIRAFRARSLGPGAYAVADSARNFFVDQVGDMLLEGNLEYRFDIVSVLKGAIFLDGGNIWLVNENEDRPEGVFNWNRFYNEIAVGTGFGLRVDVDFFVIRLDLGFPLRKPWLEESNRWVVRDIDFGSGNWRRNNLVINIAIGYPF